MIDTKTSSHNDSPHTPMRFLQRSAEVFPNKDAIVYGARRYSYREFAQAAEELSPRHPLTYHDGRPGYMPRAEYTRDANRPRRRSAGWRGTRRVEFPVGRARGDRPGTRSRSRPKRGEPAFCQHPSVGL